MKILKNVITLKNVIFTLGAVMLVLQFIVDFLLVVYGQEAHLRYAGINPDANYFKQIQLLLSWIEYPLIFIFLYKKLK
jgi:hypothetical protein